MKANIRTKFSNQARQKKKRENSRQRSPPQRTNWYIVRPTESSRERHRERKGRDIERERERKKLKKDMDSFFLLVNADGILVKSFVCVYTNACCCEGR